MQERRTPNKNEIKKIPDAFRKGGKFLKNWQNGKDEKNNRLEEEVDPFQKTREMPCGVLVSDSEQAEYEHRSSCNRCTTLF